MRALAVALTLAATAVAAPSAARVYVFNAFLDGPSEAPPVASPGTGFAKVFFDDVGHTMTVQVEFEDLVGPTTVAHIHAPTALPGEGTAGVATAVPTFPGFPAGVTFGSYVGSFDMTLASSYRPQFITDSGGTTALAEARLLNAMLDGKAYLNVHSSFAQSGEIRGFLTAVPEPATWALMIAGFGLAGAGLRSRRRIPGPAAAS